MRPGSKFLAAACIWSFVATLPAQAVPATTEPLTPAEAEAACLREARWPIESAASYRHSDVRGKTQLRNTSSSQVRRMERVCRALTSTSRPSVETMPTIAKSCWTKSEGRPNRARSPMPTE